MGGKTARSYFSIFKKLNNLLHQDCVGVVWPDLIQWIYEPTSYINKQPIVITSHRFKSYLILTGAQTCVTSPPTSNNWRENWKKICLSNLCSCLWLRKHVFRVFKTQSRLLLDSITSTKVIFLKKKSSSIFLKG